MGRKNITKVWGDAICLYCELPVLNIGLCSAHYRRWRRRSPMDAPRYPQRVNAKRRHGMRYQISSGGYIMLGFGKGGRIFEHRKLMSDYLGRPLEDWEVVHHKNGDRQDNRLENLEVMSNSTHTKHHWAEGGKEHFGH